MKKKIMSFYAELVSNEDSCNEQLKSKRGFTQKRKAAGIEKDGLRSRKNYFL